MHSVLDLSKNNLGNGGYLSLLSTLKNSTRLVSVNFGGNDLSGEPLNKILHAIGESKTIISVKLGSSDAINRNKIGNSSAAALSQMLSSNLNITFLNL